MSRLLAVFFCFLLFGSSIEVSADEQEQPIARKKILLAVPQAKSLSFWLQVEYFARLVAKSLNVELYVHQFSDGDKNRYQYAASIENVISKQFKPDAIVSIYWLHGETKLLELSKRLRIPLITFNSQLNASTINRIGRPRQKYRYWRAHLFPDDTAIGEQVAELLFNQISKQMPINMFAIAGDTISSPSLDRLTGLQISLKRYPNVNLLNIVYTDWDSLIAKHKMLSLLRRFDPNDVQLVWTASDQLANGVVSAIEHLGYMPGKHMFIGGVDWTPKSLNLIRQGKQLFSLGGHFVEAGKGIILAHEILHGYDFIDDLGTIQHSKMTIINQHNIDKIEPKLNGGYLKSLDFKPLSKHYNSSRQKYQLDIENLLSIDTTLKTP